MFLMPRRSIYNPFLIIIFFDNIASAIAVPVLLQILYPCGSSSHCQIANRMDNIALFTGMIFLLSPSYFVLSPIMGWLSDIYGRRSILLGCLALSLLGYTVLLTANICGNVVLTLLSILLLNAGSSSMTIVQAAIADHYQGIQKSYFFGLISFVMLPLYLVIAEFGTLIIKFDIININFTHIIISFAFIVTLFNIGFLILLNRNICQIAESPFSLNSKDGNIFGHSQPNFNLWQSFKIYSKTIIILLILFALFEFSSSLYDESIKGFLIEKNFFTMEGKSLLLPYKLFLMTLGLFVIFPIILKWQNCKNILLLSLLLCCLGILGSLFIRITIFEWLSMAFFTIGEIMLIPIVWTMLSDLVSKDSQGLIMGIKGTIWSLTWSLGLILGNKLSDAFSLIYPIIAIIMIFFTFIISQLISYKR